jgi:hypothetical protein
MQTEMLPANVNTLLDYYLKQGVDARSAKLAAIAKHNNDPHFFDFNELDRILAIWQKPCSMPFIAETIESPIVACQKARSKKPHAYRIKQLEMYLRNE